MRTTGKKVMDMENIINPKYLGKKKKINKFEKKHTLV